MKKFGIIGAGKRARLYSQALVEAGANIQYIASPTVSEACRALAFETSSSAVSVEEAFTADLDGVVIATPMHTQFELAMRAIERGWDVLLEKPGCETAIEASTLMHMNQVAGGKVTVAFSWLWETNWAEVSRHISRAEQVKVTWTKPSAGHPDHVLNLAVHPVSVFCRLWGAVTRSMVQQTHDSCQVDLEFGARSAHINIEVKPGSAPCRTFTIRDTTTLVLGRLQVDGHSVERIVKNCLLSDLGHIERTDLRLTRDVLFALGR